MARHGKVKWHPTREPTGQSSHEKHPERRKSPGRLRDGSDICIEHLIGYLYLGARGQAWRIAFTIAKLAMRVHSNPSNDIAVFGQAVSISLKRLSLFT